MADKETKDNDTLPVGQGDTQRSEFLQNPGDYKLPTPMVHREPRSEMTKADK